MNRTTKRTMQQAKQAETAASGYKMRPVHMQLPVQVVDGFITKDGVGAQIVVARVLIGNATVPVKVVLTVKQALAADVIERVD